MPATVQGSSPVPLTVMTQNLYLGADLTAAVTAPDVETFLNAVGEIYQTVLATDFESRAGAIADEIEAERPGVIGLQEVTGWAATRLTDGASLLRLDFLAILQSELEARGLHYDVASVSENADIGPLPLRSTNDGCFVVVAQPLQFNCVIELHDRDVILIDRDTAGLKASNPDDGNFVTQLRLPVLGQLLSFDRGWASVDVKYRGMTVRVVTTHLEVASFAAVQVAQAQELLSGPLSSSVPIIALGDFNSAADGSTTDSYELLIGAGLNDAWSGQGDPGYTCCQNGTLTNEESLLSERIDLILSRGTGPAVEAHLVNDDAFQDQQPLWPSDHAGVVAAFRIT